MSRCFALCYLVYGWGVLLSSRVGFYITSSEWFFICYIIICQMVPLYIITMLYVEWVSRHHFLVLILVVLVLGIIWYSKPGSFAHCLVVIGIVFVHMMLASKFLNYIKCFPCNIVCISYVLPNLTWFSAGWFLLSSRLNSSGSLLNSSFVWLWLVEYHLVLCFCRWFSAWTAAVLHWMQKFVLFSSYKEPLVIY